MIIVTNNNNQGFFLLQTKLLYHSNNNRTGFEVRYLIFKAQMKQQSVLLCFLLFSW